MVWGKTMEVLQLVVLFTALLQSLAKGIEDVEHSTALAGKPPPPPLIIRPPFSPPFRRPPPMRFLIAVEGVIYCKSCKLTGYDKNLDASPLPGAVAELQCNSRKHMITVRAKTDQKGYFLILAPRVTTFAVRKCKVVVSSPFPWCNVLLSTEKPTSLKFERIIEMGLKRWALFAAGFYEFSRANKVVCP